jgi:glycosyltransferase involved in cell wall biosynthesis
MAVLLAHPGSGPFVRQSVEALDQYGLLDRFATTLISKPGSVWQQAADRLAQLVGIDLYSALSRRPSPAVDSDKLVAHPLREIVRTLASRLDRRGVVTDVIWDWMTKDFDRWSASLIGEGTSAVYGYEYNALALFGRAAQLGIPRILDVPCAEHEYVSDLIEREIRQFPELERPYEKRARRLRATRTARRRDELTHATLVVANSQFTVESYRSAGIDTSNFRVVPLGAPDVAADTSVPDSGQTLRMVFAGAFSITKGAHVLSEAMKAVGSAHLCRVDVYGEVLLPSRVIRDLPSQLVLHGRVGQAQLFAAMVRADVLVQPSLSDGFGMVVAEAMAHGLPVIASRHVGAAALIEHGVNGLVVAPGDSCSLAEAIAWCQDHRVELRDMRPAARAAAAARPWSRYRQELAAVVAEHIGRV